MDFGPILTIPFMFYNEARIHPNSIACILDNYQLTYKQLSDRVQQLVNILIKKYHILIGSRIIQCLDRSIETLIGILAIMSCGSVYVPISVSEPVQRIIFAIEDIQPAVIITQLKSSNLCLIAIKQAKLDNEINIIEIDNIIEPNHETLNLTIDNSDNSLIAYIIYTSGSTGTPKGAQISYSNYFNLLNAYRNSRSRCIMDGINMRMIQTAPCSFDVHLAECISSLMVGGTTIMLKPDGNRDLDYYSSIVQKYKVSHIVNVPSFLSVLIDTIDSIEFNSNSNDGWNRFKSILNYRCIGEQLKLDLANKLMNRLRNNAVNLDCIIVNAYGPAEITDACTIFEYDQPLNDLINNTAIELNSLPIGKSLTNYQLILLDEFNQLVTKVNIPAFLCVGGAGVFSGYWNRAILNKSVLLNLDFLDCVVYQTGDLVKLMPSGDLFFLGRADFQVKLHGQRLEIGEIETIISKHTSVKNCIVMKSSECSEHLCAYIEPNESCILSKTQLQVQVQALCKANLASYMVPSVFCITTLPLNLNNKIDRKQLPKPSKEDYIIIDDTSFNSIISIPKTQLEIEISNIFAQILSIQPEAINIKMNLLKFGVTSLSGMQALTKLRILMKSYYNQNQLELNSSTSVSIDIVDIFSNPTIYGIAQLISEPKLINTDSNRLPSIAIIPTYDTNIGPAFNTQVRFFLDSEISDSKSIYNTNMIYKLEPLSGISYPNLSSASQLMHKVFDSCLQIVSRHSILRTSFQFKLESGLIQRIHPILSVTKQLKLIEHIATTDTKFCEQINLVKQHVFDLENSVSLMAIHAFYIKHSSGPLRAVVLMIQIHHLVFDGSSELIFMNELRELMLSCKKLNNSNSHTELQLPRINCSYLDYSIFMHQQLNTNSSRLGCKLMIEYWEKHLEGADKLYFPIKSNRMLYDGQRLTKGHSLKIIDLNGSSVKELKQYAESNSLTMFMLFLSIFTIALYIETDCLDLCLGVNFANRSYPQTQPIIGFFTNILPYRIQLSPDSHSLNSLTKYIRSIVLFHLEHGDLPLDVIINKLQPNRSINNNGKSINIFPYFQAMLHYISIDEIKTNCTINNQYQLVPVTINELISYHSGSVSGSDSMNLSEFKQENEQVLFDFAFVVKEHLNNDIEVKLSFSADLYSLSELTQFANNCSKLIRFLFLSSNNNNSDSINMMSLSSLKDLLQNGTKSSEFNL